MIRFTMCPIAFWGNGTPSPGCPRYRAARVRLEEQLRAFCSLNISMGSVCSLIARVLLHVARSSAQAALDGCRLVFFDLAPRWTAFRKQCNKAVGHNCFCDIWRGTGCCSPRPVPTQAQMCLFCLLGMSVSPFPPAGTGSAGVVPFPRQRSVQDEGHTASFLPSLYADDGTSALSWMHL